ncbi:Receptor-type tyrosine-protein phosphatase C [Frankliniella fusca]|uniref:Receptor-type tyrosine-protein phosphatase C n=1 Tax=Frankliniella fusca TaxID=407009 RepID=A0AAE1GY58_9NEOP|nr:Receptor-type tyrosine-protein phosphatase C [Frankliniella fusca]
MAGAGAGHNNPACHQHHGNSHDRIFGVFGGGEAPAAAPNKEGGPPGEPASSSSTSPAGAAPRQRRRWVHTRTQHLSHFSLNDDVSGDSLATPPPLPAAGSVATTENASYGAPSIDSAESGSAYGSPSGRYGYRRPDGNPVTGEGYARSDSCDLQAAAGKK